MISMLIRHPRPIIRLGCIFWFARQIPASSHRSARAVTTVQTGEEQFEAFFQRYERQITAYLCRVTGDEQTARDLCQETFVSAWQHFPQLQEPTAARAWLYRVATNLALRLHERRQAHPITPLDETFPGASDPGRRVAERDRIQQALMTLTAKQRSALILHEVHGLSCDEVGQLLHLSRDAVKMAIWRGREQFRRAYLSEGEQL
jgi:RNA polymerase sigma-70 factor, ECF subfamily